MADSGPPTGKGRKDYQLLADPDFAAVRKVLRAQDKTLPKLLNKALKEEMGPIVSSARRHAGAFSTRIPRTIRPGADRRGPYVRAGNQRTAPHAGVWEGSARGRDRRHPVFGGWPKRSGSGPARPAGRDQWVWADQRRRPYLSRAAQDEAGTVAERVAETVVQALTDGLPTAK